MSATETLEGRQTSVKESRRKKQAGDLTIPQFITGNMRVQVNELDNLAAYTSHQEFCKFCFVKSLSLLTRDKKIRRQRKEAVSFSLVVLKKFFLKKETSVL